MSAIPLIALTADRPFELQAAGASQCLDQTKLYGDFVRCFLELGHPYGSATALDGLVRMLLRDRGIARAGARRAL